MIGQFKKWLGIDCLKLEIVTADIYDIDSSYIDAELILYSKCDIEIENIEIVIVEKYIRGRLKDKKTDHYTIGKLNIGNKIEMTTNKVLTIPIKVPIKPLYSSMDKFGMKNAITKGISTMSKLIKGVKSAYRMEVEVKIKNSRVKVFKSVQLTVS